MNESLGIDIGYGESFKNNFWFAWIESMKPSQKGGFDYKYENS